MKLGRLSYVDVRSVWPSETEFTQALAEPASLELLADTLQLGALTLEAGRRLSAGAILARDADGAHVLIEPQLEPGDERSTGQAIADLAAMDGGATVVWIGGQIEDDQRAAIGWLNANTDARFGFFGVELQLMRIGQSDPAAEFAVVATPAGWSGESNPSPRPAQANASSQDRQKLLLAYWSAFGDYLNVHSSQFRVRKPSPDAWISFPVGKSGFAINITAQTPQRQVGAELLISRAGAKADFQTLISDRAAIEDEFGEKLIWEETADQNGSRIATRSLDSDPAREASWPEQHAWALAKIERFHRVFSRRSKSLPDFQSFSVEGAEISAAK